MERLDALLSALEQTAPVEALKTSFVAYPLVNAAHILAIGAVVTTVLLMDLRILGLFRHAEPGVPIPLLRNIALSAFAVAALTGLTLFSVRATDYVDNPAFLLKMGLLALAIANLLVFLKLGGAAAGRPGEQASPAARAGAVLSIALWLGVLVCGRFIGFL